MLQGELDKDVFHAQNKTAQDALDHDRARAERVPLRSVSRTPAPAALRARRDASRSGSVAAGAPSRRVRGPLGSDRRWAVLFLAPTLVGLLFLSAAPIGAAFGISLTEWDLLTPPDVRRPGELHLAPLGRAVPDGAPEHDLLHARVGPARARPGPRAWRWRSTSRSGGSPGSGPPTSSRSSPPPPRSASSGCGSTRPTGGLLNQVLISLGIPPQRWIADPFWAMPAIIVMSVWQGLGTSTIIFLAGLQARPAGVLRRRGRGRCRPLAAVPPRDAAADHAEPLLHRHPGPDRARSRSSTRSTSWPGPASRPTPPSRSSTGSTRTGSTSSRWATRRRRRGCCSSIVAVLTAIYFRSQRRWVHYQ